MLKNILILFIASAVLIACQPVRQPEYVPWQYADVRALDPADGPAASQDLTAVSIRRAGADLQIRLDLLDSQPEIDYDLYLVFDQTPGGKQGLPIEAASELAWDLLLAVPASGSISATRSDGTNPQGLKLRVMRDPSNDTVVISFARKILEAGWPDAQVEVFLTPAGSAQVADRILGVSMNGAAPPPIPILLGFWNTFPADTPAQALRRWNGAHSGPNSERNGLSGLLAAVQSTGVPVFLFDLKTPAGLSALDYLGAMPLVQNLASLGLLGLPDTLPFTWIPRDAPLQPESEILPRLIEESRQAGLDFDLPAVPHLFSSSADPETKRLYRVIFYQETPVDKPTSQLVTAGPVWMHWIEIERRKQAAFIALPAGVELETSVLDEMEDKPSAQNPPLSIRRFLANAAGERGTDRRDSILLLGGELPRTHWGNSHTALQYLEYIAKKPWLKPMSAMDLDSFPMRGPFRFSPDGFREGTPASIGGTRLSSSQEKPDLFTPQEQLIPSGLTSQQIEETVLAALQKAPPGRAAELAWQAYRSLLSTAYPSTSTLAYLRQAYLGQIGCLTFAAEWEAGRLPVDCRLEETTSCAFSYDLDWDGMPEYGLASRNWLALFEAEGGYLVYGFVKAEDGFHEVVGPSSQLQVGLSDPSLWKPERGVAGDPAQYRGAFSDLLPGRSAPGWDPMQVEVSSEQLSFTADGGSLRKTFKLEGSDLVAEYDSAEELLVQIPLVIDPWLRFSPSWGKLYQPVLTPVAWRWGLAGGLAVLVEADSPISARSFIDSAEVISQPEDPGYEYPPGHFLPFPMALVEVQINGLRQIRLRVIRSSPPSTLP